MRIHLIVCVLAGALSTPAVFAQQEQDEHAAHHPAPGAEAAAADQGEDKVQALVQNMKKIQDLMKQIHAASDPGEKQSLMAQHLRAMRDQMRMVLAMRPGMGMKGGMGGMKSGEGEGKPGAKEESKGGGMMGGGMMKMHKQMEGRMRMLEMMLEQMLEREAVEAGAEHER